MSLKTTLRASIGYRLSGTPDLGSSIADFPGFNDRSIASGVGDNQADRVFSDRRTLAASGNEDIDLAGSLVDPLGGPAVFAKVKAIMVKAAAENTNNVVVGAAASNAFQGPFGAANDTIAIPPGGVLMLTAPKAGWAVTAGTGDLLRVANSGAGTPVTYDIVIVGTSA